MSTDKVHDALILDGFRRADDWLVKNEGEQCEELIHIDTVSVIARAAIEEDRKLAQGEMAAEPKEVVDQILSHLSRCIECSVYENEVVPALESFVYETLAAPQAAVPANNSEHQVERDSLPAAALGRSLVDAARYRYLRDSAVWDDAPLLRGAMVWCVIGSSANACRPCETDELDEAIDEALAAAARTEAQQDEPKITDQRALVGEPFLPKDSLGHSV